MIINICGNDVILDDEDYELISSYSWHKSGGYKNNIYYATTCSGIEIKLHRFIMKCSNNDGITIDHINGNTLDNRKCNLRACDHSGNMKNTRKRYNNISGYKGVSWKSRNNKWVAQIQCDKKKQHIGLFNCPTAAWLAYIKAARLLHGEFARL